MHVKSHELFVFIKYARQKIGIFETALITAKFRKYCSIFNFFMSVEVEVNTEITNTFQVFPLFQCIPSISVEHF